MGRPHSRDDVPWSISPPTRWSSSRTDGEHGRRRSSSHPAHIGTQHPVERRTIDTDVDGHRRHRPTILEQTPADGHAPESHRHASSPSPAHAAHVPPRSPQPDTDPAAVDALFYALAHALGGHNPTQTVALGPQPATRLGDQTGDPRPPTRLPRQSHQRSLRRTHQRHRRVVNAQRGVDRNTHSSHQTTSGPTSNWAQLGRHADRVPDEILTDELVRDLALSTLTLFVRLAESPTADFGPSGWLADVSRRSAGTRPRHVFPRSRCLPPPASGRTSRDSAPGMVDRAEDCPAPEVTAVRKRPRRCRRDRGVSGLSGKRPTTTWVLRPAGGDRSAIGPMPAAFLAAIRKVPHPSPGASMDPSLHEGQWHSNVNHELVSESYAWRTKLVIGEPPVLSGSPQKSSKPSVVGVHLEVLDKCRARYAESRW